MSIDDKQLDEWQRVCVQRPDPEGWNARAVCEAIAGVAADAIPALIAEVRRVRAENKRHWERLLRCTEAVVLALGEPDEQEGDEGFETLVTELVTEHLTLRREHANMSAALAAYIQGHESALMRSEALGDMRTQVETQRLRDMSQRQRVAILLIKAALTSDMSPPWQVSEALTVIAEIESNAQD